jgi:hypothetical protein
MALPPDFLLDPLLSLPVQLLHCLKSLVCSFHREFNFVQKSRVELGFLVQASRCCVNRLSHLFPTSNSTFLTALVSIVQQLARVDRCRRADRQVWEAAKGGRPALWPCFSRCRRSPHPRRWRAQPRDCLLPTVGSVSSNVELLVVELLAEESKKWSPIMSAKTAGSSC